MTAPHLSHTQSDAILNHFLAEGFEGLPGAMGLLINAAIERSQHLQATANERTDQRYGRVGKTRRHLHFLHRCQPRRRPAGSPP